MRANAQRDGRSAEYRWRALFNAAKFGWRPLLECHAVRLPRRETHWNLLWCPKLPNGSQPLVDRSSLYSEDMWGRYCCLTSFFPIVDTCLSGWNWFGSSRHLSKFQRLSRLGSVTAHGSGRQPNCGVEQRAPPIFGRAASTFGHWPTF